MLQFLPFLPSDILLKKYIYKKTKIFSNPDWQVKWLVIARINNRQSLKELLLKAKAKNVASMTIYIKSTDFFRPFSCLQCVLLHNIILEF